MEGYRALKNGASSAQKIVQDSTMLVECRRQKARAIWLRRIFDKQADLHNDLTTFIDILRLRYKVGIGSWMRGSNNGVIANPQRLVAMILKYLLESSKELERLEEAYNAVVEYRAGAAVREKMAQKKAATARMHAVQAQFRREREQEACARRDGTHCSGKGHEEKKNWTDK